MANAAPAVAFPAPVIFEGTLIDGCVRRSDPEFPIEYRLTRVASHLANGKGRIFYGERYNRVAQGRYEVDVRRRFVVIKQVRKAWLRVNPNENIMSEIYVAQAHGDNGYIGNILDALEDRKHYYIIMPYLGRNIFEYLRENGPQPQAPPEVSRLFVENLAFLKSLGIIHCDVSAENIMVIGNNWGTSLPLIDFAMAKQCARDEQGQFLPIAREIPVTSFGKLPYMSPEMVDTETPGNLYFGVDMWAIGCTLFLLWTGNYLFQTKADASWLYFMLNDNSPEVIQNERVQEIISLFQRLSQQQQNLLRRICIRNPEYRVTVDDILNDPYFTPIE